MPDSLKLLPLYLLVLLKTPALRLMTSIRNLDLKVSTAMRQLGAPFAKMAYQLYPRVYRVTDVTAVVGHQHDNGGNHEITNWGFFANENEESNLVKPRVHAAMFEKLDRADAYVLDSGESITLYVGSQVPDEFVQQCFGY